MEVVDGAQFRLRPRLAQDHGARQSWQQLGEAKTAVESKRPLKPPSQALLKPLPYPSLFRRRGDGYRGGVRRGRVEE